MQNVGGVLLLTVCAVSALSGEAAGSPKPDPQRRAVAGEALRWAEAQIPRMADAAARDAAWIALARAWGALDPARGLDLFPRVSDSRRLEGAAIELCALHAQRLVKESGASGALKTIQAIPHGSLRHLCGVALGERWAQIDFDAAAAWARSLPRELDREWTLYYVARGIARSEPEKGLLLARDIRDPFFIDCLRRDVAMQQAQRAPATAWIQLEQCPAPFRLQVAEEIGWQWGRVAREAAREALNSAANASDRTAASCGLSAAEAQENAAGAKSAAAIVRDEDPDGTHFQSMLRILTAWSGAQPAEALEWVGAQTGVDTALRQAWLETVLREYARRAPDAARIALETSGAGPEGWSSFAEGFAQRDAKPALAWAKSVGDLERRCYAFIGVARGAVTQKELTARP